MKRVIILIAIYILIMTTPAFAAISEFELEEHNGEIVCHEGMFSKYSFFYDEPTHKTICSFDADVNYTGDIVIGCETGDVKFVLVYSKEMHFKYGMEFHAIGFFRVESFNGNVNVYFNRSNEILSIDFRTQSVKTYQMKRNDSNTELEYEKLFKKIYMIDNSEYRLANDICVFDISHKYSMLIKRDSDGTETILYKVQDATVRQIIIIVLFPIAVILLLLFLIFHIKRAVKKNREAAEKAVKKGWNIG